MLITAILVTYNSADIIGGALSSVRDCALIRRCLVVDNASQDNTREAVRAADGVAELIENAENIGFGRANNLGMAKVETPYALLLNPDARIDDICLHTLLAAAERYPEAVLLAPRLLDADGHELHTYKRSVFDRERISGAWHIPEGDLCADFLSGAVWLVRTEAFQKLGGFDPAIFLYYEDDDFCLRARAAGYACVLVGEAKATHWVGKSSLAGEHFRQRHMEWSRLYVEEKYKGKTASYILAVRMAIHSSIKWLAYVGRKRQLRYAGRLRGILHYLAS